MLCAFRLWSLEFCLSSCDSIHRDLYLRLCTQFILFSDAVRLSSMVDVVVLVVKDQQTTRNVLKDAYSRLQYAQAKILGVVLNQVDLKSGDYGYYYDDYYRTTTSPVSAVSI